MTSLLAAILAFWARLYLARFKPRIVAITGNTGKTTTKEAIAAVLRTHKRVRASAGNLNNELGVPLAILGERGQEYYQIGGGVNFWLGVLIAAPLGLFAMKDYPEILVLEYGADKPGDIARLAKAFPPHVGVITQIGQVPVHVEFFASPEHLAQEKMQLIRHLQPSDHAVLNYDDQTVLDMKSHTAAQVHTFGMGEGADVRAGDVKTRLDGNTPLGISADLIVAGHAMPLVVNGTLGGGIASACAAAVAVGQIFTIGLADAVQALSRMRPPAGRMRILRGIKDTVIIDDTYNASPAAMHLAIDTVRALPGRKVFVLGDMLELGEHTPAAHQAVSTLAASVCQELVCVGERTRFIADAAGNQMPAERIHWFHDSDEAKIKVQELLQPGDVVLVKGSQGKRMERVVKEIMAEPDRAGELLVRQSKKWLNK